MSGRVITSKEYESVLAEIVGVKIAEFSYITDRIIVFNGGKKIQIPVDNGEEKETRTVFEYDLQIDGDWDYLEDGVVIETSKVKEREGLVEFRERLVNFEDNFEPKTITKIEVKEGGQEANVCVECGGIFKVKKDREMFVSLYRYEENDGHVKAYHVEVDEETDKLTYFEAKN